MLLAARQGGGGVVGHAHEVEPAHHGQRALAQRRLAPARAAAAGEGVPEPLARLVITVEHEVLEDGQAREAARDLECPHEPGPRDAVRAPARDVTAVEDHTATLRRHETGDAVKQRRLAGAVGTDETGDRAGLDREVNAVQRADAVEGALQAVDVEQGHGTRDAR
jgi:hypothetical protein